MIYSCSTNRNILNQVSIAKLSKLSSYVKIYLKTVWVYRMSYK